MARYRTRVLTPWSPTEAFDYMADLENFAKWDPGVSAARRVAGTAGSPDAAYDVDVKRVGGVMTLRYTTVAVDSPNRIEVRAETSLLISLDVVTVEAAPDGGSFVTYDADLSLKGVLGVAGPLLSLFFDKIGDRAAAGMRTHLQGTAA